MMEAENENIHPKNFSRHMKSAFKLSEMRPVDIKAIQTEIEKCLLISKEKFETQLQQQARKWQKRKSGKYHIANFILAVARTLSKQSPHDALDYIEKYLIEPFDKRIVKIFCEILISVDRPGLAYRTIFNHNMEHELAETLAKVKQQFDTTIETCHPFNKILFHHNQPIILNDSGYRLAFQIPKELQKFSTLPILDLIGTITYREQNVFNGSMVAVQFIDENDEIILDISNSGLKFSNIVGAYSYINPQQNGIFNLSILPPEHTKLIILNFRNWKNSTGVELGANIELNESKKKSYSEVELTEFQRFCRFTDKRQILFFMGNDNVNPQSSMYRSSRIIEEAVLEGFPVVNINTDFNFNRAENQSPNILNISSLDFFNSLTSFLNFDFGESDKVLIIVRPLPSIAKHIHKFQDSKWKIISDLSSWNIKRRAMLSKVEGHIIGHSNSIILNSEFQRNAMKNKNIQMPIHQIIEDGYSDLNLQTKKKSLSHKIGIFPRTSKELDFDKISRIAIRMSEKEFQLVGSTWPEDVQKPENIQVLSLRKIEHANRYFSQWDAVIDVPVSEISNSPPGLMSFVFHRIPCIITHTSGPVSPLPYVIVQNSEQRLEFAINEAIIMKKTFVHSSLEPWSNIFKNFVHFIETVEQGRISSTTQFLPLNEIFVAANLHPPNINKIRDVVYQNYVAKSHETYSDIKWLLDYVGSNPSHERAYTNLLLGILRGIGKADEFSALQLSVSFPSNEQRILRTLVTLNNRVKRYNVSLQILDQMDENDWKGNMRITLEDRLKKDVNQESNGMFTILSKPNISRQGFRPKVACLLDRFSFDSFSKDLDLYPIPKMYWKEFFESQTFDFVLAESIWTGHDNQWKFAMTSPNTPNAKKLDEMLSYIKSKKIPSVFWNKEDPVNFEKFIDVAKRFDYIFTSDNQSVDLYKEQCHHKNIFPLSFACEPTLHNPVRNKLPNYEICFAGSWYHREHGDRKRQTKLLIDAASNYDLHIYDRFYGTDTKNAFPEQYNKYIRGSLTYDECRMAYKSYSIFLNVNSVINSMTMFSRRVYELLASSTYILSTPSIGMSSLTEFGITVVDTEEEAEEQLKFLTENPLQTLKHAHFGHRVVMQNHTYEHRSKTICEKIGIQYNIQDSSPLVSLITCSNRPAMIDNILSNFNHQTHQELELIILMDCNKDEFGIIENEITDQRIKLIHITDGLSLGHCFNLGLDMANGEYIAKFDDDDLYGSHYVEDMLLPFKYTDAEFVGKHASFMFHEKSNSTYFRFPNKFHRYCDFVLGPTFFFKKSVKDRIRMQDLSRGEDTQFLKDCKKAGIKIYSTDPFNFVYMRKMIEGFHTWDATDDQLLTGAKFVGENSPKEYSFI